MTIIRKRRPSPHPRRTLELLDLLAISPAGATEALLVRVHGFNADMIAGLLRAGLATTESKAIAGAMPAEVVSIRITEAGQEALNTRRAGSSRESFSAVPGRMEANTRHQLSAVIPAKAGIQ